MQPDLIIRTNRRSMSITISKDGRVIVRAPKKLGIDRILSFVNEKERWINKHLETLKKTTLLNSDVRNHEAYLLFGKKFQPHKINGLKKIELSTTDILYPASWDDEILNAKINKFYKQTAAKVLADRLEYFAQLMQLEYKSFKVRDYKSRWGCCSRQADIILNYRVIMLPHKLIDYIIIHELSHILEFNHSKEFYHIVACVMPDYKTYQKQLKDYSYLLQM